MKNEYIRHSTFRAGLNEREAPGKVVTARSTKRSAQLRSVSNALVSTLQKHPSNVKTYTIWQPTLQRQSRVTMYGGSYVVNLFEQKVASTKTIFLLPWHYTTIFFVVDSHSTNRPITYTLKDVPALSRRSKRTPFREKYFSTKYHAKATWTVLLDWSSAFAALK